MAARHALSGFPYPGQESRVMNAWDRLVCGAELPANAVRTVIENSWARCLSAGVDPARTRGPSPTSDEALSRLLHRFRDVIDASSPVMDQVRDSLSESGTIMSYRPTTGSSSSCPTSKGCRWPRSPPPWGDHAHRKNYRAPGPPPPAQISRLVPVAYNVLGGRTRLTPTTRGTWVPQADAGFSRIPPGRRPPGGTIVHIPYSQWMNRQDLRREEMATAAERRCRADARNGSIQ
jgi:hypothetical protein